MGKGNEKEGLVNGKNTKEDSQGIGKNKKVTRKKGVITLNLKEIVEQLKKCEYTCQAGPLENNTAFIELEKLSNQVVTVVKNDSELELVASISSENAICHNDYKIIVGKE